jgi:hypothetical protein
VVGGGREGDPPRNAQCLDRGGVSAISRALLVELTQHPLLNKYEPMMRRFNAGAPNGAKQPDMLAAFNAFGMIPVEGSDPDARPGIRKA